MRNKDKFRRMIFILMGIVFLLPYHFVRAGAVINEIMYDLKTGDDNGREWVEIFNGADTSVNLSSFRFFEADTNHKLKLIQGNANVEAQGYAIIVSDPVKFKTDWPNFAGTIFDSSFSLSNDGEVLAIKDGNLKVVDQYAYQSISGGAGNGKSLQKINGIWQGATPTPGAENRIIFVPPPAPKSKLISSKVSIGQNKNLAKEIINEQNIPAQNLPAQASDVAEENNDSYFFIIILILLLGTSAGTVYFIRRKRIVSKAGDDFKILDE